MTSSTEHRWDGWPGAVCLECGLSDRGESALADKCTECVIDPNMPVVMCKKHTNPTCLAFKKESIL